MSVANVSSDELDQNIVELVQVLNSFDGIETIGSCGGHLDQGPGQWPEGHWYVKFNISQDRNGWFVLEFLAWAINNDMARAGWGVTLYPYAPPPYLNWPGKVLSFCLEGHNGKSPEDVAKTLRQWKAEHYVSPEEAEDWSYNNDV